jgi:hypothetical protein
MVLTTKVVLTCGNSGKAEDIDLWYERRSLVMEIAPERHVMYDWHDPDEDQWYTTYLFNDPDEAFQFRLRV